MFSQRRSYYSSHPVRPAVSLCYSTTQFVVVLLCCLSLRHDDMKFIAVFFFFKGFCAKQRKKSQRKINHYSVIEHNALSNNYMENNIIKCLRPKMTGQNDRQDESLTRQVHDQAGHCPLTGCYFEPCNINCCNLLALIGVVLWKPELSFHSSISAWWLLKCNRKQKNIYAKFLA